jgi:GT2 family glycosyltransferase
MTRPSVSTVIVTHNEGDLLRKTVESFLGASVVPDQIVVVDDQSTDGSTEFLVESDEDIILVRPDEPLGISRARNLGARSSAGDVVVFADAHVEVSDEWLPPLLDALGDHSIGEVAPAVGWLDGRPGRGFGFTWSDSSLKMDWLREARTTACDVPFLCGCFLAMRREVFDEVGGFDNGMYRWGFEDSELSLRLWLHGYRCQAVPQSFIRHHFRTDFPYAVDRSGIIYNALRLATVHFDQAAIEQVVTHYCRDPAFGKAWVRLFDSDTWQTRDAVAGTRTHDIRWLLDRFDITCL